MTSISAIPQHPERAPIDAAFAPVELEARDAASLPAEPEAGDAALSADPGEPEDMQAKLDRLIDSQAESGALSDAQANELRSFFAQRVGGETVSKGEAQASASPTRPISEAATRQLDAMAAFLDKLRNAAASGAITYGSNSGTSSNGSSATGWVIDTKA